jgi:hypothetical protein
MALTPLDYAIRRPPAPVPQPDLGTVLGLALLLIPLECAAALFAYHTIGEVLSYFLLLAVALLNVPAFVLLPTSRRAARAVFVLVALGFIGWQLFLAARWCRVYAEAERVVAYAQNTVARTGRPPANLNAYKPASPGAHAFIRYTPDGASFHVSYWIGTPTTSHTYRPGVGWTYYPD